MVFSTSWPELPLALKALVSKTRYKELACQKNIPSLHILMKMPALSNQVSCLHGYLLSF